VGSWQRAVAALLFLAGFLLVWQVRAYRQVNPGASLPSYRLDDLLVLIRRQQDSDRALRDEVNALNARQQQIRLTEDQGRSVTEAMHHEIAQYRFELGMTPVEGQALAVTLAADPRHLAVPQAQDVAMMVNEMWGAGAEALAVNGIRVLATDGVLSTARGIRIGARATVQPYVIVAIGDPTVLEGALLVSGGAVEGLRGVGLTVTFRRLGNAVLPASPRKTGFGVAVPLPGP
jgi:uncharacterized protein YlxW (UPF0749 family)